MAEKTGRSRPSKNTVAVELARRHFELEDGLSHIFRLKTQKDSSVAGATPIALLEVNENSVPTGIMPVYFGVTKAVPYPTVIIEITPEEFEQLESGDLKLPTGWRIAEELSRPAKISGQKNGNRH